MIWFSCKQCGKTHGRVENSIGATIFCDCGHGVLVPWESTAPEPEAPVAVPASLPPPLKLEPVTFDPTPSAPGPPPLERGATQRRRRPRVGPRDPRYCFNHEHSPKQSACADCGESFCSQCLVTIQKCLVCGPCKNFRVRVLMQPGPTSKLALASAVLAFIPALPIIMMTQSLGGWFLGIVAIIPQGVAITLGIMALREAERDPGTGGRSLAFTGVMGALLTSFVVLFIALYTPRVWT